MKQGSLQSFQLLAGNRGNVNTVGVPVWIVGIPQCVPIGSATGRSPRKVKGRLRPVPREGAGLLTCKALCTCGHRRLDHALNPDTDEIGTLRWKARMTL